MKIFMKLVVIVATAFIFGCSDDDGNSGARAEGNEGFGLFAVPANSDIDSDSLLGLWESNEFTELNDADETVFVRVRLNISESEVEMTVQCKSNEIVLYSTVSSMAEPAGFEDIRILESVENTEIFKDTTCFANLDPGILRNRANNRGRIQSSGVTFRKISREIR